MFKILKVPFDSGNPTGSTGTAKAPDEIAKLFPKVSAINVAINQSNIDESFESIEKTATKEFKNNNKVCAIGGDHSITYAMVKAASNVHKDLSLIYFDAHLDCEDDFLPPSHEDVIKAIVKDKLVKPENILIVGARKWWPKEEEFVKKQGITVITPSEMKNADLSGFMTKNNYISVDIDVFDPKVAPATNYTENDGLTLNEFQEFTQRMDFKRIIGFDIVEVSPQLEKTKKTVTLASDVIKFLL
jgi:agmatinase